MTSIAMIPARLGSQRLKQKNLMPLAGEPLIVHAIRKCQLAGVFDEIWVNTESDLIGKLGIKEGVGFHHRPENLASNIATSEQFVAEFLRGHPCTFLFQVHSIAPLLTATDLKTFANEMHAGNHDTLLSVVDEPLEAFCDGRPVNFSLKEKTNSQDLSPVRRISWSVTAWRRETFLGAADAGACATYAGRLGMISINRFAGHVIKTSEDLEIAEALMPLVHRGAI